MTDVKKNIYGISSTNLGDNIAIVLNSGDIIIYSLLKKKKISQFNSIHDIGGCRLSLSEDSKYCVVGAYDTHGIAMYNSINGEKLWQRKDLKKVQYLHYSNLFDRVVACFDSKSMHLLDKDTGEILEQVRAVRGYRESTVHKYHLYEKSKYYEIYYLNKMVTKIKCGPLLTDAIFPDDNTIAILELEVYIYDLKYDKIKWLYKPEVGYSIQAIGYCEDTNELMVTVWCRLTQESVKLVVLDKETGDIKRLQAFDNIRPDGCFVQKENLYISYSGHVIDVNSMKTLYKIDTQL